MASGSTTVSLNPTQRKPPPPPSSFEPSTPFDVAPMAARGGWYQTIFSWDFCLGSGLLRQVFLTCNFATATAVTYLIFMKFSIAHRVQLLLDDKAKFALLIQFFLEGGEREIPILRFQLPNHSRAWYKAPRHHVFHFPCQNCLLAKHFAQFCCRYFWTTSLYIFELITHHS